MRKNLLSKNNERKTKPKTCSVCTEYKREEPYGHCLKYNYSIPEELAEEQAVCQE